MNQSSFDLDPFAKKCRRPLRKWVRPASDTLGVNLIGPIEYLNGLGTSCRGYLSSIKSAGIQYSVTKWNYGFEHLNKLNVTYQKDKCHSINLVHLNLDLLSQGYLNSAPLKTLVSQNRYNVCILYWELASVRPEWHHIIQQFDEIWCASSFMARAIDAVSTRPIRIVRPALDFSVNSSLRDRSSFGLPSHAYLFFYAADASSVIGRKNPEALLRAYIQEFSSDEQTCCLLKIGNTELASREMQRLRSIAGDRQDVILMNDLLTSEDLSALYGIIDCYVSPHRAEGLGLTILEAMAAQKPIIATQYGGASDFVTEETAYPLEHRLIEIGSDNQPYPSRYIWAEPEIISIQKNMRHVFQHRQEAIDVGKVSSQYIRSMFSAETTSMILRAELERIWASGEQGAA